jgi:acetyltransferase
MLSGTELFVGAKYEKGYGHLIMAGLGGIFIEVLKDISSALTPVSKQEAELMINSLKSKQLFEGVRGIDAINKDEFIEIIQRVSQLVKLAPEIVELDLNPLLATKNGIIAVDSRICIEK